MSHEGSDVAVGAVFCRGFKRVFFSLVFPRQLTVLNRPSTPLDDLPIKGSYAPDPPVRGLFLRNFHQRDLKQSHLFCSLYKTDEVL